ncbi:MAG: metal-dependent hydrolase [Terriglobia bacterium]
MDNLTHTLTGIAIAQAGLKRKTRFAMLALIIASNLPDIDVAFAGRGTVGYLTHHRAITHSLLGLTVLSAILAAALYALGRRTQAKKSGPRLSMKWLFAVCWIGMAVHVLMDFTNAYGVRPFLPFSGRWYAWGIMPIVDFWLLFFLILGLCVPLVLGLITEEVGGRRSSAGAVRKGAIFALCALVALWGCRALSRHRAVTLLGAHTYGDENPDELGAFPTALNPFEWNGVAETDSAFYTLRVNSLASDLNLFAETVLRKPPPTPALAVAQKTEAARVFLNFARLPYAIVYSDASGFRVYIRDLRFVRPGTPSWNFVLETDLDPSLHVKQQSFHFQMTAPLY